jgi:molecular chaperone GrpE
MNQDNSSATPEGQASAAEGQTTDSITVESLQAALKEQQSKYLYLYAEFETFKKRAIKERSELLRFGHEGMSRELLSALDNFERALEHAGKSADFTNLLQGIRMVHQQVSDTLSKFGIVPIDTVGQKFDPERHEAVAQDTHSQAPAGTITQEHQKGYTLHGRLLRPARVVVASSSN